MLHPNTGRIKIMEKHVNFETLVGKTITSVEGLEKESEEVIFKTSDGKTYKMYHRQSCCESVYIEDVWGDVENIINSPVLLAEENSCGGGNDFDESYTWTFYKMGTVKGWVDIRWYGTSNGYYSESVDFVEIL